MAEEIRKAVSKVRACVSLEETAAALREALKHPKVMFLGEILSLDNVQALQRDPTTQGLFRLTQIFSYGTIHHYQNEKEEIDGEGKEMTEGMKEKLMKLTIVSLCGNKRSVDYDTLMHNLRVSDMTLLETLLLDLLIDGLVKGRIDSENKLLEVDSVAGRDVDPKDLMRLHQALSLWKAKSDESISLLDLRLSSFSSSLSLPSSSSSLNSQLRSLLHIQSPGAHSDEVMSNF
eukprot:TRINITY_DN4092_c0_g1_i1.p1 TRINITY_DN4092_c0_g1~~TRINITY_DN4092_c0_g1_i1.p1  ORF type:complete len:243 (-),score=88.47 TRINITY_DN4092_c0_g1_i1:64-759(-)